jgi:hypothetical protein
MTANIRAGFGERTRYPCAQPSMRASNQRILAIETKWIVCHRRSLRSSRLVRY